MNRQSVVVCVTDQQSCVRLIHEGSRISREKDLDLHVLSVVPLKVAPRSCGEALEYLFSASRDVGAEMTVFYNTDVLPTILDFLEKKRATDVVLGEGDLSAGGFMDSLLSHTQANLHVVDKKGGKTGYRKGRPLDYNKESYRKAL